MAGGCTILFIFCFLVSTVTTATTVGTIIPGQAIRSGESTVVSTGQAFELGFFPPGRSSYRYLGIWYKKLPGKEYDGTVIWVANRDTPLSDSYGVLTITEKGVLVLRNSTNDTVWSSTVSKIAHNPVAVLLESGNLVVKDANEDNNPDNFLWQSFDYPCDNLLSGMKLGVNLVTGLNRYMSSWKSKDDPAHGDFKYMIDPHGVPQLVLKKGNATQFRAGPWNGLRWTGVPQLRENPVYGFEFVWNEKEVFYRFNVTNSSVPSRMVLSPTGVTERLTWIDRSQSWKPFSRFSGVTLDQCDNYALCGAYASCNINMNTPSCECLEGFKPKFPDEWSNLDWSNGCVRKTQLNCKNGDGFLKHKGVKLPDTRSSRINKNISLLECEILCLNDCSCTAYANSDIRGSGCLLWFGELVDIRSLTENQQDLHIRMAASELASIERRRQSRKKRIVIIIVTSVLLALAMVVLIFGWILYLRKKKPRNQGNGNEEMDLPIFDWAAIANATCNFSDNNKLGEGGFGPVYKGILLEGQEIAVKKLSKSSGQGKEEFKNEVILIAKLQHRNLVKLLGCSMQKDERLLIYEYMPNKSLDYFIFDEGRSKLMDWNKRVSIIGGIARGLLYLHQDSRLRIIHRDLKASNILLDKEMNPKISDFGLARTFGGDQTEANTNRVVGTYGYMSPEYAVDGLFSVKSDVFSFGVIVLEIVSGKKNRGFHHHDHQHNLLGHAWRLWIEGRPVELIDKSFDESSALSEVLRCIHVGLLCVQQAPEARPNMSTVVLMLCGEGSLPQPKQPGFFTERNLTGSQSSSSKEKSCSTNEITVSLIEGR
ncbi:G-type lectin S-receptor-like serine/threonine-protein kinase At4g27290 [Mangifera indica]|uniref:G-type lectin S-receptor-like serine/threonine-protein kinase At4g27290 n=1 Tax=Mangifera indica TaxID=29780 RepID=UPI001CFAA8D1|nr:G-type lectin S-receptor-like serine/threonine-protein kinase At4g27290 [Mangifera indica]